MKICTILGARPQFIKAAALSRVIQKKHIEVLIHTGQHYDKNMSDVFFDELSIPNPDYNLGIAGGTHGHMTGQMLCAIEDVLVKEKPDFALVYGDTNSTLAGALAAVKLHIPICHVEAGIRMKTFINPEEVNRVLVDRISTLLFCCTQSGVDNLANEGIINNVYNVGDLMYDAVLYYGKEDYVPKDDDIINFNGNSINIPKEYYLLTCHREENTENDAPLLEILSAMNSLDFPTIYPVHPRNRIRVQKLCQKNKFYNILLVQPVGYKTSLYLIKNSKKVVTDSGGLQREAWFYGKPCITLLTEPLWPETFDGKMNQMCAPILSDIIDKLLITPDFSKRNHQFGDGHSAEKIVKIISAYN